MNEVYKPQFYAEWKKGFDCYVKGEWENALEYLTVASNLGPGGNDGPSQSLISYIESHKGKAPVDWKGHRIFD